MKMTNALNFILSAIAPVRRRGVIAANIISNLAKRTPGMVGAYFRESLCGTPERKVQSRLPASPPVSGPNVRLNPNVNHMTLKRASPKNTCIKIDTVFFFRKSPASNKPRAGIMSSTKLDATSIHAVSPELIGKRHPSIAQNSLIRYSHMAMAAT